MTATLPASTGVDATAADFVAVARDVLRTQPGAAALDALDWWELTDQLGDLTCRLAVFALFRAQGHELACTPALGAVLAQPWLAAAGVAPGELIGSITRRTARGPATCLVVGELADLAGRRVVVVDEDGRPQVTDIDTAQLRTLGLPGRLTLHEIRGGQRSDLAPDDAATASAARLGRIALAAEMLGAAEGAVEMAVTYAGDRHQFGAPIGSFQAVRHLLAWARTETTAVGAVLRQAELLHDQAGSRFDEVVKAIAGRNTKFACERAMQVLGGIAFTAELEHHHFHSRVLQLDALLGTSADLTHDLGTWVRAGHRPDYARRIMTINPEE